MIIRQVQESDYAWGIHLRDADKEELRASGSDCPVAALREAYKVSRISFVIDIDGKPFGFTGVTRGGVVWALTTSALPFHRKEFIKGSKVILGLYERLYTNLHNYVYAGNIVHIRWLKRMGFDVRDDTPILTPTNHKFYYFHKRCN